MADEDEIDVLGDCSLDSFLPTNDALFDNSTNDDVLVSQNTELLKCDYTIHPQWLLDKPSTNPACWYNTNAADLTHVPTKFDAPKIAAENAAVDESGWTEKEKNLLVRGIEIFGKSNVRLSQFVGSKTPVEVKNYLRKFNLESSGLTDEIIFDYIEETVVTDNSDMNILDNREVLNENEIPASIEEVIATVSTANSTVTFHKHKKKNSKLTVNYKDIPGGQSLLKRNYINETPIVSCNNIKQSHKHKLKQLKKIQTEKKAKFKFKAKVTVPRKGTKETDKPITKSIQFDAVSNLKSKTSVGDIEIVMGNGLSIPLCTGEEVIKIKKKDNSESESDVEIDIEDSDEEKPQTLIENSPKGFSKDDKMDNEDKIEGTEMKESNCTIQTKLPDLTELSKDDVDLLMSMEFPKSEFIFDQSKITDLEKFIHYEFFEGRSTKTPSRYLKIRNHILNVWNNSKPSYVTKTSIRHGLKQCGDVNCISRVHQFLEQIGAINFKCPQTSYIRPLYELVLISANIIKDRNRENDNFVVSPKFDNYYRNRNKKKFVNDGEGGYTLQHDDKGQVINTTVINEDPIQRKQYIKKPIVRLIYCRPFTEANPQEYEVRIALSTIVLMDLHSHSSLSEIMGLIGGYWNETKRLLKIVRYEPCKNLASSSTHCDMCPITQAKAAENIHRANMDVLGWFHSHPTFAPEPSQQDIDTQLSIQQCFGEDKPCVGVIMSPFSSHGALIASPYRCMVVGKKENFEDQYVPYKLKVDVDSTNLNVNDLLNYAWSVFNLDCVGGTSSKVDFTGPYFQDTSISYLEKFISSIKMHLAKCSNINKMTCDAIQDGLFNICCNKV